MSNIIYIEFLDKTNFPVGEWKSEPDICHWEYRGLSCLMLRDMKLGAWKGFVALKKGHVAFNKSIEQISGELWSDDVEVYGGIVSAGKLPARYKEFNKDNWWIGFECMQGEDLLPLVKFDPTDPIFAGIRNHQTYKNIHYVRRETNQLAKQLIHINK